MFLCSKEKENRINFIDIKYIVASLCKCDNKSHLVTHVNAVVGKEGAGVIARQVASLYRAGRSQSLLKFEVLY
jgi:hypothetical protein